LPKAAPDAAKSRLGNVPAQRNARLNARAVAQHRGRHCRDMRSVWRGNALHARVRRPRRKQPARANVAGEIHGHSQHKILSSRSSLVKLWRLENNMPRRSGTLRKRAKLHGERERLRIYRKARAAFSEKKGPRLQERNETAQDKGRFSSSSLLMQCRLQLLPAAFSPAFERARFAPLFPATSSALLPATLI